MHRCITTIPLYQDTSDNIRNVHTNLCRVFFRLIMSNVKLSVKSHLYIAFICHMYFKIPAFFTTVTVEYDRLIMSLYIHLFHIVSVYNVTSAERTKTTAFNVKHRKRIRP